VETSLTWVAAAIGAIGIIAGFALARTRERTENDRSACIIGLLTVVAAVLVFLLTRPIELPFSPGQRLGYGVLIGGILGALAGVGSVRLSPAERWRRATGSAALGSLAVFGTALILLLFGDYPQPALAGFMIGAVVAGVLFRLGLPSSSANVEFWTVTAVTLAATVTLAVFRYDTAPNRFWWRAPLMILCAVIIGQFASVASARDERKFGVPALITSAVTLLLAAVFAWRMFPDWALLKVVLDGIVTFALVAWLTATAPYSTKAAAVSAAAVLALCTLAFRFFGGFGIGIAILAGWAVVLPSLSAIRPADEEQSPNPTRALVFATFIGLGALMFRLFLENYSKELRGLDLRSHYTFISLALGAMFPFVLLSFFPILPNKGPALRSVSAAVAGLFCAAAPLALVMIWGMKPALAFVMGSIVSEIFVLFLYLGAISMKDTALHESAVLALTAQVSAVVLSGLVLPLIETPRVTRIIVLCIAVFVGLIWSAFSSRLTRTTVREG
jgi:hypothetical protein